MSDRMFRDRRDAGRVMAHLLAHYRDQPDLLVLALPRGGVPVAYEVAMTLGAPLDVFGIRKLGVPGREELAMGAIASGGVIVLNDDVVRALGIAPEAVQRVAAQEGRELRRREEAYREGRPPPDVAGRTVIVVDDGLATGASMRAAIQALRQHRPAEIVVAVPAAATQVPTDAAVVRAEALPVDDGVPADEVLFDLVGDAHYVLIGESSHGTHEFYAARAAMTRRLIEEWGFRAVAVEADWPDAYRVNRYVRGRGEDADAEEAMRGFERFPAWMWRNTAVLDFVGWPREHNDHGGDDQRLKTGFYGLDLYSLHRSIQEVIAYLETVDPAAAERARERYACFDHASGDDGQAYGFGAAFGGGETCEQQVVDQLVDLQRHACRLIGFTTYTGTMTAADDWGEAVGRKWVRPALPGSVEELFHSAGGKEFVVSMRHASRAAEVLRSARLERAIGVIYRPDTERQSHYFRARAGEQFDALVHIDQTRAVEPLERTAVWERGEVPETYPVAV